MKLSGIDTFNMFRNRSILKILRCWAANKKYFVCFVDLCKANYTFKEKLNSVKKLVIIMSVTVTINRYGYGLFNSCYDMKITFFPYVLCFNNLHSLC